MRSPGAWRLAPLVAAVAFLASGCHTDMWTQPKALPQQESDVLPGGMISQHPPEGTIPRGGYKADDAFYTGFRSGKLVAELPATLNINGKQLSTATELKSILSRGKERFTIYCSPCHGALGDGRGMIATRGLELRRPPATYHTDRLRQMPIGHFFDVITSGYGAMYSYAYRVEVNDRWAIAAYIRALQYSQNRTAGDIPEDAMQRMSQPQADSQEGGQ